MPLKMKYFVLKPMSKIPHDPHATASRLAMIKYAETIEPYDEVMANELRLWVDQAFEMACAVSQSAR